MLKFVLIEKTRKHIDYKVIKSLESTSSFFNFTNGSNKILGTMLVYMDDFSWVFTSGSILYFNLLFASESLKIITVTQKLLLEFFLIRASIDSPLDFIHIFKGNVLMEICYNRRHYDTEFMAIHKLLNATTSLSIWLLQYLFTRLLYICLNSTNIRPLTHKGQLIVPWLTRIIFFRIKWLFLKFLILLRRTRYVKIWRGLHYNCYFKLIKLRY